MQSFYENAVYNSRLKFVLFSCLLIFLCSILLISCKEKAIGISNIELTESSLIIEVISINTIVDAENINFPNNNWLGLLYTPNRGGGFDVIVKNKKISKYVNKITILLDLTDIPFIVYDGQKKEWPVIYINEEATISMRYYESMLIAKVLIEKDKITLLEQQYKTRGIQNVRILDNIEDVQ